MLFFLSSAALVKASEGVKMHAAVHVSVQKTVRAAAQEKLASMRSAKHLIKAATVADFCYFACCNEDNAQPFLCMQ